MTKKECLLKLIQSREYDSESKQYIYSHKFPIDGCKLFLVDVNCKISMRELLAIDKYIYDRMYPVCKKCKRALVDTLPKFNFKSRGKYKIVSIGDKAKAEK